MSDGHAFMPAELAVPLSPCLETATLSSPVLSPSAQSGSLARRKSVPSAWAMKPFDSPIRKGFPPGPMRPISAPAGAFWRGNEEAKIPFMHSRFSVTPSGPD